MTQLHYKPSGVCSRNIEIELEGEIIRRVEFTGGCNGNGKGLSSLLVGMNAKDAIQRLRGTICEGKKTSCPDQLSRALEQALAKEM